MFYFIAEILSLNLKLCIQNQSFEFSARIPNSKFIVGIQISMVFRV